MKMKKRIVTLLLICTLSCASCLSVMAGGYSAIAVGPGTASGQVSATGAWAKTYYAPGSTRALRQVTASVNFKLPDGRYIDSLSQTDTISDYGVEVKVTFSGSTTIRYMESTHKVGSSTKSFKTYS